MDILFVIAIFMLPFENLFFAPSAGWATITPIIFFIYVIFNYKYLEKTLKHYGSIVIFLLLLLVPLSIFNYLIVDGTLINNILNSLISLTLGIANLFAFDIYFIQKQKLNSKLSKILLISYSISIFVGIVQIVTIKLNISFLKSFFAFISKRNYLYMGKVQFTFTEPSYIGMHLFGILLPFYFMLKDRRILKLIIVYLVFGLLFSGSVRLLLDFAAVMAIILIFKNLENLKVLLMMIIIVPTIIVSFNFLYFNNSRVRTIVDKGVYADSSLASRYFRINAASYGYRKQPIHFFIGYGLGNSIIPIKDGYRQAFLEYDNSWKFEIDRIGRSDYSNDAESLCFYIKFISDFGVITLILFLNYIFKLRQKCNNYDLKNYVWILLYLYIQFESYAFYSIWLYIVFLKLYNYSYGNKEVEKNESE